jgi:transcriptional regulator with XRE-family HTH domain
MNKNIYYYTESGLDNVTIFGVNPVVDDSGEETVSIANLPGLHRTISFALIKLPRGLNGKELRFIRTEMGLTQAELALLVHKDGQTVGRWERNEHPIGETEEMIIRLAAAEKLKLDISLSIDELARSCVPSAEFKEIRIDGSKPDHYPLLAA